MSKTKSLAIKAATPLVLALSALSAWAQTAPTVGSENTITTVGLAKTRILTYANTLLGILGLVAVIMLIYGGYLYVTGGTNEDSTKKAKSIILYGFIGIAVAVLSYAIVNITVDFIGKGGTG